MALFPQELLHHIFSQLQNYARPGHIEDAHDRLRLKTLASAARVSKSCHRIVLPMLYYTLDIRANNRLRPFLSTCIRRPHNADMLRRLHLPYWTTQQDLEINPGAPGVVLTAANELDTFVAATRDLALPKHLERRMVAGLRKGLDDAEVALLMALCPKLELLDFVAVYNIRQSTTMAVIEEAIASQKPLLPSAHSSAGGRQPLSRLNSFSRLRSISVEHWDTEGFTDLAQINPLLRSPALEILKGFAVRCDSDLDFGPVSLVSIKRVDVRKSLIDAAGFTKILSACPRLEVLSVEWGSATVGDCEIKYDTIGDALREHGTSLRKLILKPQEAFYFEQWDAQAPLGNLKALSSLELLSVPQEALMTIDDSDESNEGSGAQDSQNVLVDVLPNSLSTLKITECDVDDPGFLDGQLSRLMADDCFASVQAIRLERGEPFGMDAVNLGWDDKESNRFWVVLKRHGKDSIAEI